MKVNLVLLIIVLLFISCDRNVIDDSFSPSSSSQEINDIKTKRVKIYQNLISQYQIMSKSSNGLITSLGFGYDFTDSGVLSGSYSHSLKEPVVDINYLYSKDNFYTSVIPLLEQESRFTSFHTFEELIEKHYKNKFLTVKTSLKSTGLVKWLVKAKVKYEYESNKIFASSQSRTNNNYYASGEVLIRQSIHSLNLDPINRLLNNHLTDRFYLDIHFLSAEAILEKYGQFFVSRYTTGAKAYSLAYAQSKTTVEESQSSDRIKHYGKLSMGIVFKSINASSNGTFEQKDSTFRKYTDTFETFDLALKTLGGDPSKGIVDGFKLYSGENIPTINISLKEWGASLTRENEVIVEIADGGLVPLSTLVREKNIADLLEQQIGLKKTLNQPNVDPMKKVVRFFYTQDDNGKWYFAFSNRFGDYFIFAKSQSEDDFPQTPTWINWNPFSYRTQYNASRGIIDANSIIDISELTNVRFCKIKDSKIKDITYILMDNGIHKIALSIFDELTVEYKLQIKKVAQIDSSELNGYTVYAL